MDDVDDLRRQVDRMADRLADLGATRLGAPAGDGLSVADAAHALAQALADAAAEVEGRDRRAVPRLADRAVADQVAVTGRDLVAALQERNRAVPPDIVSQVRSLRDHL